MGITLNNMGIVVDDLDAASQFFEAIGLEQEGRAAVEGQWPGKSRAWAISESKSS